VIGTSPMGYQPWLGEIHGLAVYSKEVSAEDALRHYKNWTISGETADLDEAIAYYGFTERKGLEIHNAVVSGPDLEIPRSFAIPYKGRLTSPIKEFHANWRYLNDVLLNIAGFVPIGFAIYACFALSRSRRSAVPCTILAAGFLSFVIEVLQAYIPRRVSGTTDIITNTLGAALGAWLARPNLVRAVLRGINSLNFLREVPQTD